MRNIKARYLWITSLVLFLAGIGLIFACVYTKDSLNRVMVVIMAIDFVLLTFTIQFATTKSLKFKPKKVNYITKEYKNTNSLAKVLVDNGFEKRSRSYGDSYLLIKNKNAYKVVLVSDPSSYFNNDEDNEEVKKENTELDECNVFIGVEVFLSTNSDLVSKLPDFTLEGGRIYYTALEYKGNNNYLCHNYVKPNKDHIEAFNNLLEMLGFVDNNGIEE